MLHSDNFRISTGGSAPVTLVSTDNHDGLLAYGHYALGAAVLGAAYLALVLSGVVWVPRILAEGPVLMAVLFGVWLGGRAYYRAHHTRHVRRVEYRAGEIVLHHHGPYPTRRINVARRPGLTLAEQAGRYRLLLPNDEVLLQYRLVPPLADPAAHIAAAREALGVSLQKATALGRTVTLERWRGAEARAHPGQAPSARPYFRLEEEDGPDGKRLRVSARDDVRGGFTYHFTVAHRALLLPRRSFSFETIAAADVAHLQLHRWVAEHAAATPLVGDVRQDRGDPPAGVGGASFLVVDARGIRRNILSVTAVGRQSGDVACESLHAEAERVHATILETFRAAPVPPPLPTSES